MNIPWEEVPAAIWRSYSQTLKPVRQIDSVELDDLLGIDAQKTALCRNTERFLGGEPSNHALLWGSRGTGKSTLIRALLNAYHSQGLRIIEVDRDDLQILPEIIDQIRDLNYRFVLYSDDLSFTARDSTFKALKTALEGSIEPPPGNVRLYATSNRRHLLPESLSENERSHVVGTEIHHSDAIEEGLALADRFGLCLSFYPVDQPTYLQMVDHLAGDSVAGSAALHREAIRFALQKGGRSGRAARQFIQSLER